jgi:hypothetical protein
MSLSRRSNFISMASFRAAPQSRLSALVTRVLAVFASRRSWQPRWRGMASPSFRVAQKASTLPRTAERSPREA